MNLKVMGREINPHYDAFSVSEMEERLNVSSFYELDERVKKGKVRVRDMLIVVWAGCLSAFPMVSVEQISKEIEQQEIPLFDLYRTFRESLLLGTMTVLRGKTEGESQEPKN